MYNIGPNVKYYFGIFLLKLRKLTKFFIQGGVSSGRDAKRAPAEYSSHAMPLS
jgi:hypothetical protein